MNDVVFGHIRRAVMSIISLDCAPPEFVDVPKTILGPSLQHDNFTSVLRRVVGSNVISADRFIISDLHSATMCGEA